MNIHKKEYTRVVDLVETARENITRYGYETFSRAFPSIYDGLKPIHRRILFTMWQLNAVSSMKVAQIVGQVMGHFHPHGDSSISDSLVRLAQPWEMNYPYIIGQGNYGNQDGDDAAASRYIEAKLSPFALFVSLEELDTVSVNYEDNYNYDRKIAQYLPSKIPLVLINGVSGLGEAFKVNIPPHNLNDIAGRCIKYIKNKHITNDELVEGLFPDFPTGGEIINGEEVARFYHTGTSASIALRGKAELIRETNAIILKEFPYGVDISDIKEQVKNEIKHKNNMILMGIENWNDNNGYNDENDEDKGFDEKRRKKKHKKTYEYACKKDSSMLEILQELYRVTSFQTNIQLSFIVNEGGKLKYVTIRDIIENWYTIRVDCKRRKHTNAIAGIHNKKHILEGILQIYAIMNKVITCIRENTEGKEALIKKLHDTFNLTLVQSKGIYEMPLGSLSKFGKVDLERAIHNYQEKINENEKALLHIDEIIINELTELKEKFSRPRATTITMNVKEHKREKISISKGAFLISYNALGLFDMNGVRDSHNILTGLKSYKINGKNARQIVNGKGLTGKTPIGFIVCYADGTANRIPFESFKVINTWLIINTSEVITASAPIYDESDILICLTEDNKIKRIEASAITGSRKISVGAPISEITGYSEDDTNQIEHLLMAAHNGTYNLSDLDDIPLVQRNAAGVKSAYDNYHNQVHICPLPGELYESERLFVGCYDDRDSQNYIVPMDLSSLTISNRTGKPKKLLLPEHYNVTSIAVLDINDKNSQLCMIGRNSTSTLSVTHFKKSYEPKRIFLSPLIITLL
jgi:DNA gyrase/topoisomerase IV subunit A